MLSFVVGFVVGGALASVLVAALLGRRELERGFPLSRRQAE